MEHIREIAGGYNSRAEFRRGHPREYTLAKLNNRLDEFCEHMTPKSKPRCVYVIVSPSLMLAYVGLTCDHRRRLQEHTCSKDQLMQRLVNAPDVDILLASPDVPAEIAPIIEQMEVQNFREFGFKMLNKWKAGNLGGN